MFKRSLLLLLLFSLSPYSAADAPLNVVVTIKPVHSLLVGLMKGVTPPTLLIDGEQSPYTYTLSDLQKKQVQQADLLVWVGPELEQFMQEPIQNLSRRTTLLTLLDNPEIKLLPSRWDEQKRDPFFWLDSRNAIIITDELAKMLMQADPERRSLYERNRHQLLTRLATLDRQLEYDYRGLKSGIGMAYYDTLQYFEQAYALKIRGVVTQSPTTPVSGESLLENRAKLNSGDYSCLLTEQHGQHEQLPLLTQGINLNITPLDSFGTTMEAGEDLYFTLMEHNTKAIKTCLQYENSPHQRLNVEEPVVGSTQGIGGKFMLHNHFGQLVTDQDLLGKFHLLYFGYTFCPDVCPTSLITVAAALNQLGEAAEKIQPYFITVDPKRDTPEALRTYVTYFHPSLVGLTGTQAMTDRVAALYRVKYEKVIEPGRPADQYIIDHSSGLFLMAPDGRFITKFAHGIPASEIANRLKSYLDQVK